MPDPFDRKLAAFARAHRSFVRARNQSKFFRNVSFLSLKLMHHFGHVNSWGQNILDQWEPEFSCSEESRVPETLGDGPKWICGAAQLLEPCNLVSLGSNFDARFERAMHTIAGCHAYVVDPTLVGNRARLGHFHKGLLALNATLNTSVGIGRHNSRVKLMQESRETRLVGVQELLRDRFPGPHRFVSVLKVDVEGSEYDVLNDVFRMCREGQLSIDVMTVEMHVGLAIKSGDRERYTLRDLRDAFENASDCNLMLHHKERNAWGCDGYVCVEYSFVSVEHARRTFDAFSPGGGVVEGGDGRARRRVEGSLLNHHPSVRVAGLLANG